MGGIIEKPTNFRVYYTCMKNRYTQVKEDAINNLDVLQEKLQYYKQLVDDDFIINKKDFPINLEDYSEYINNKYIDGELLRIAKGILLNKKENYELVGRFFNIYSLAKLQKDIYDLKNNIAFYNKLLNLTLKEYNNILKLYYTKVQEKLIIDGFGYVFEGKLGWICINRCKLNRNRPHIDYQATRQRKEKLKAEGKRIYNKEEAEWCEKNGIDYKAEDGRVFQNIEHVYEIPLLGCKLTNGSYIKFQVSDYRGANVRGKHNSDILKESNGDKYIICSYDVDIRTKLNICLEADKLLYSKFIRNENQKASVVKQTNS